MVEEVPEVPVGEEDIVMEDVPQVPMRDLGGDEEATSAEDDGGDVVTEIKEDGGSKAKVSKVNLIRSLFVCAFLCLLFCLFDSLSVCLFVRLCPALICMFIRAAIDLTLLCRPE